MPRRISVLCIPTGDTHITSDMCAGIHISLCGRYQSVEGMYVRFYVRGMKIQAWRCLSVAKGVEESKSKIKNDISKK